MKKEMNIREWLKARDRMCNDQERCHDCPASYYCKGYKDIPEEVIDIVEQWAAEHPEPKRTRLEADETVNVFTIEVTRIGHCEYSQDEKEMAGRTLAYLIRSNIPSVDDAVCIRAQQFITKSHEEEV